MKRGFTIAELVVVISVIAVLASVAIFSYRVIRDQATDAEAKSMVAVMTSALNRYYQQNNEYPTAEQLSGNNGSPTSPPSNYTLASGYLNLSVQSFSTPNVAFSPCTVQTTSDAPMVHCGYGISNPLGGKNQIKYITKHTGSTSQQRSFSIYSPNGPNTALDQCEIVFRSNAPSSSVYVMTYFSREENKVKFVKSAQGDTEFYNPESGQCVFTAP